MIDGPCSWNAHVLPQDRAFCPISSVAGAYAPAFVERGQIAQAGRRWPSQVSPELMLRPSLSAPRGGVIEDLVAQVSPELMLRPSLSGVLCDRGRGPRRAGCRRSLCSGLR